MNSPERGHLDHRRAQRRHLDHGGASPRRARSAQLSQRGNSLSLLHCVPSPWPPPAPPGQPGSSAVPRGGVVSSSMTSVGGGVRRELRPHPRRRVPVAVLARYPPPHQLELPSPRRCGAHVRRAASVRDTYQAARDRKRRARLAVTPVRGTTLCPPDPHGSNICRVRQPGVQPVACGDLARAGTQALVTQPPSSQQPSDAHCVCADQTGCLSRLVRGPSSSERCSQVVTAWLCISLNSV
jgi:hypothetical protein